MKSISIFGFTGSIGSQALDIIEKHQEAFKIDVFVCKENIDKAINLINVHKPKNVFIFNPKARLKIIERCSNEINFFQSYNDLLQQIHYRYLMDKKEENELYQKNDLIFFYKIF